MIDIAITSDAIQHTTVIIPSLIIWFICMLGVSLCLTDHLNVTFMVSSLVFTFIFAGAASAYIVEGIFPPIWQMVILVTSFIITALTLVFGSVIRVIEQGD